jgi:hypothetical protein
MRGLDIGLSLSSPASLNAGEHRQGGTSARRGAAGATWQRVAFALDRMDDGVVATFRRYRITAAIAGLALLARLVASVVCLPGLAASAVGAIDPVLGVVVLCTSHGAGADSAKPGNDGLPAEPRSGHCADCPVLHALGFALLALAVMVTSAAQAARLYQPVAHLAFPEPRRWSALGARAPPRPSFA